MPDSPVEACLSCCRPGSDAFGQEVLAGGRVRETDVSAGWKTALSIVGHDETDSFAARFSVYPAEAFFQGAGLYRPGRKAASCLRAFRQKGEAATCRAYTIFLTMVSNSLRIFPMTSLSGSAPKRLAIQAGSFQLSMAPAGLSHTSIFSGNSSAGFGRLLHQQCTDGRIAERHDTGLFHVEAGRSGIGFVVYF